MKKNFKRTLAAVMAAALTVTMAGMPSETDAAKKKPIKLSKSSVTVTKGKTKKVTIKNVKKKQVKKLKVTQTKKAKKIATVTKSGKTALKVKGKKAGSAKATVSVTVKGKKKATKLKLTVKVKAAKKTPAGGTTQTQTPAGTATPGGTGTTPTPGGLNPGDTTPPSQGPGTQTDEPNKSERPGRTRPPATENPWPSYQAPSKRGKDMILKYTDEVKSSEAPHGGKLEEAGKIAFKDAAEGWTLGEGEKFDIMEYDRIVIKLNAKQKATMGAGDDGEQWSGKVGLSSTTNENLGATKDGFCTQYDGGPETKGRLVFLNDIDGTTKEMFGSSPREDAFKTEAYPDGYLVEYVIPGDIAKNDWWSPDDVSKYCDCINLQLANKGDYSNIYVEEIQLLSEKKATTDNLEISAGNATVKEGGSTKLTVSLKGVPDYAEITEARWSAEPAENAEISGEEVADSKKEAAADVKGIKAGDVTVTATVTVKIDGTVTEGLKVSKAIKVEKKDDTEPSSKPSTEPEPSTEPSSKPSTEPEPSTEPSAKPVTVVPEGALALTLGDMKEIVKGKEHAYATVSLAGEGTEDMKITAVEWSAVDSEKAECGDAEPEEDGKSCTTAVTGLKAGKTKIRASVTVQEEGKAPSEPATVVSADEITVISEVTKEDLTIGISKSEIRLNETATVEVGFASTAADGAEITDIQWAVSETGYVETTDISTATTQEFIGKAETPDNKPVTIKATVTVAVGTKEFKDIVVTVPLGVVSVPIEATVETPTTEVVAGETVSVEVKVRTEGMGYADPENAVTGVTWSVEPESKASIETQNKERVIIKTKEAGEVKVTASVTVTDGETRTKDFWCTINVQPVFEADVAIGGKKIAAKGGELTLSVENNGEGDIENVAWPSSVDGAVVTPSTDKKTATVTVNKAGDVTFTVEVTVKKGKQPDVVTKTITVKGVELEVKAPKKEFAANETAGIEVAIKGEANGVEITGVDWNPDKEGIVEIQKAEVETAEAVLAGKAVGTVTVTPIVTVSAEGDDDEVKITLEGVEFAVTPIEYDIVGKKFTYSAAAGQTSIGPWAGFGGIELDEGIPVKKTDKVEVILSVKSGEDEENLSDDGEAKFQVGLCTSGKDKVLIPKAPADKVNTGAESTAAGRIQFGANNNFKTNSLVIASISSQTATKIDAKYAVVTIEKIIVSPTVEVSVSLTTPGVVGNVADTVVADVDMDGDYTIEWSSSDSSVAEVVAVSGEKDQATITAKSKGEVTVTAVVKKDGKKVGEGVSQKVEIKPDLKVYVVNQDATIYTKDGIVAWGSNASSAFDTTIPVNKTDKVTVIFSAKIGNQDDAIENYTTYTGPLKCNLSKGTDAWAGERLSVPGGSGCTTDRTVELKAHENFKEDSVEINSFLTQSSTAVEGYDTIIVTLERVMVEPAS